MAPSSALTVWPTAIACRCSTPPTCSPPPLLDIVSQKGDLSYWTQKSVPAALKDVGFRTIKAFGAKSRSSTASSSG